MPQNQHEPLSTEEDNLPSGTILLIQTRIAENENHDRPQIILNPTGPHYATVNFTLVLAVTVVIFTALSIQVIFWQLMVAGMNVTYAQLNNAIPVYLVSIAIMMVGSFWSAWMESLPELYVTNLLQGLAGATNEYIVQITIADLFFVHHRGGMNALYMTMVMIGSFLTPVAAGTQATREGWRASYRALGIANAVVFGLFIFFYEETKYTRMVIGVSTVSDAADPRNISVKGIKADRQADIECTASRQESASALAHHHELDRTISVKTWRERLVLVTYTAEPIWPYFHRPFVVLATFPAALFCGLQYALGVVWLTIMSSVLGLVLPLPPYNFTPEQIGFMSVGPLIGNLIGSFYGGFLGDRSILLYMLRLPALTLAGGLIMFGATIARGMHWIWPSIAGALFGFGLGSISDAALTLVIHSYRDITGDAFTGVAFLRNAVSIGIPFAISPWLQRSGARGAQDMFITCDFISLAVTLTIIPIVLFGKKMRMVTANRYRAHFMQAQ
ncbi:major facilitator superfamily domain-containing protein [Aspergillus desertorum]